jgi:two-component system cell cycle sensor histidine kinase/response regulator CckA
MEVELRKILVVDDEEQIRRLARSFLEREGYDVIEAAGALDAIALLEGGGPLDLLLADLEMPVLGGDEMVQRIRATRPTLPVLYVTGHINQLLDKRAALRDGEAFLEKPFNSAGLLEAVALLLYGTVKRKHDHSSWTPEFSPR